MELTRAGNIAVVQARMGSMRLPGKSLRVVGSEPLIKLLLERLDRSQKLTAIYVAVPDTPDNDELADYVSRLGYKVLRGSETDVLSRFALVLDHCDPATIVRITGDCPLIDPRLLDTMVEQFLSLNVDYLSNVDPPTFPDGLDIEVFTPAALRASNAKAITAFDREHVTSYIRKTPGFERANVEATQDFSNVRWTVDDAEDLDFVERVFEHFAPDRFFSWEEVLNVEALIRNVPGGVRNEGSATSTGQKLWRRAKAVIPGGNMLLSKRPEMLLPEQWPTYYSRAVGCKVFDLDGNELTDVSLMGVGTNSLGYGHPNVDAAVLRAVSDGNMSTLNCPEEVGLAERLTSMHPWADMARFARSGGEANAIAVRIARAASGKDGVAICGYHGWHDWYLAANLGEVEALDEHLLPGLNPVGVPRDLRDSVHTFRYGDIETLERIVDQHSIGVIKMEVGREQRPDVEFLMAVRRLASRKGIVLAFDECTSGFREAFGGLHLKYDIAPDIAVFGKALGNGYAITAVIGRDEVMDAAKSTFISSTMWTERIGSVAALATLQEMETSRSWEQITSTGRRIVDAWHELASNHGVSISTSGLPALASFTIDGPDMLGYKTLVTQEMLRRGYLATTSIYVSTAHTKDVMDAYLENLDECFALIARCQSGELELSRLLEGPVCESGFSRLT